MHMTGHYSIFNLLTLLFFRLDSLVVYLFIIYTTQQKNLTWNKNNKKMSQ